MTEQSSLAPKSAEALAHLERQRAAPARLARRKAAGARQARAIDRLRDRAARTRSRSSSWLSWVPRERQLLVDHFQPARRERANCACRRTQRRAQVAFAGQGFRSRTPPPAMLGPLRPNSTLPPSRRPLAPSASSCAEAQDALLVPVEGVVDAGGGPVAESEQAVECHLGEQRPRAPSPWRRGSARRPPVRPGCIRPRCRRPLRPARARPNAASAAHRSPGRSRSSSRLRSASWVLNHGPRRSAARAGRRSAVRPARRRRAPAVR